MIVRRLKQLATVLKTAGQTLGHLTTPVSRKLLDWLVLQPYRLILRLNRSLKNFVSKLPGLKLLSHHQSILYLLLVASVAVTINSWHIHQAAAENYGQNNLLFPLIKPDFELLITETSTDLVPASAVENNNDLDIADTAAATDFNKAQLELSGNGAAIIKPHLISSSPSTAPRTAIEYYVVEPGDTISSIAERFGLNINTILWENRLTAGSLIRPGQKLTILPTDGVTYRIGSGDTLTKIAQRYGVKVDNIIAYNNISGATLTVGQTIIIPGGKPPRPPVVTRPTPITTPSSSAPPISSGKLLWPTNATRLTQYYSWRHGGIDIAGPSGTPIYAAEEGIVEVAGWNRGGYGYYIIIDHGGGLKTLYAHASKLLVAAGQRVNRGDHIANIGSTGRSTGPHLHFEIRVRNQRTNPLNYIR